MQKVVVKLGHQSQRNSGEHIALGELSSSKAIPKSGVNEYHVKNSGPATISAASTKISGTVSAIFYSRLRLAKRFISAKI